MDYWFNCCNTKPIELWQQHIDKPEYKYLAYYECPVCAKRWFMEIKENREEPKYFFDRVATQKFKTWEKRLNNVKHGTYSRQFFNYGTYTQRKDTFKTFKTNFNNEKEFLFSQITKISQIQ